MSDEIERLLVRVEANANQFEAQMKRVNKALYGSQYATQKALKKIKTETDAAAPQMFQAIGKSFTRELSGLAGPLAAILSASEMVKFADSWTDMTGRMRLAVDAGVSVEASMDRIAEMAIRSYSSLENTSEAYFRNANMMRELGYSTNQTFDFIEAFNNALVVSGAKGARAESVTTALSKAMAKGALDGDNLNTVIESGGRVAELIAAKLGVSTLQLAKLGKEGKITSKVLYEALSGNLEKLRAEAELMPQTVGDALQNFQTKLTSFVGNLDQGMSASAKLAATIEWLGDNLELLTQIVGVLAAVMGTRFVLSMTAGSGAMIAQTVAAGRLIAFQTAMTASMTGVSRATLLSTTAMRGFTAAIVANPVGAAVVAVAALAAGLAILAKHYDEVAVANRKLDEQSRATATALSEYEAAARKAADATGEAKKAADALVASKKEAYVIAMQHAQALAHETMQIAAQRAQLAKLAAEEALREGPKTEGEAIGQLAYAGGAEKAAKTAQDTADKANQAYIESMADYADLQQKIRDGFRVDAPVLGGEDKGKSKKSSGPTAEELAAQRVMLDLQAEIELLRAQGREAEAVAKQDQVDLLNLTAQYEKAGFENAAAKAKAQVDALATAREAARQAEEAERLAEGERRAGQLTRDIMMEMLGVQEDLALTDRDALDVRRQILAIRQQERRLALEMAAADIDATEAERAAARAALAQLPNLETNENRALDSSSDGARQAKGIIADLRGPEDAIERAREAYAEIDKMRQDDVISEQEAALAKAQIDADLRQQRLSATQTMLGALESLQGSSNKKLAALGKAAAIAQATIDGVLAVQKALASAPPPMNFIQAAVVGAVAAANVASIAGMADGGPVKGVGGPRQDNQLRYLSVGEYVVNAKAAKQNRGLLDAMNYGGAVSRMADGGLVGRANAAAASLGSARSNPSSSFSYSPTIDARGADRAAVARLEAVLAEERKNLPAVIMGVVGRKAKYRLGKNAEA